MDSIEIVTTALISRNRTRMLSYIWPRSWTGVGINAMQWHSRTCLRQTGIFDGTPVPG